MKWERRFKRKRIARCLLACITGLSLVLSGCAGGQDSGGPSSGAPQTDEAIRNDSERTSLQTEPDYESDRRSPSGGHASPSEAETPAPSRDEGEGHGKKIEMAVHGTSFPVTLYDNETAEAFAAKLPLTLDMHEMNGNEKYQYLPDSLPVNARNPGRIHNGDLMLYGTNCVVLFYEDFSTSYSYTPLGRVDNPAGLAQALSAGAVEITIQAAS